MEHKLQIQFLSQEKNRFALFRSDDIVQAKPFHIGFRFKNIGNTPIIGATVSNIKWKSSNGQNISGWVEKSFHLDTINPGDIKTIWVEKVGTYMHGLGDVSFNIQPDNQEDTVRTYQADPFTNIVSPYGVNNWMDFFYIRSKSEYEQSIANVIMLYFAALTCMLTIATFYLFFQYQIRPAIIQHVAADRRALNICKEDINAGVQLEDGSMTTCEKYFPNLKPKE
ncbi:hypothetical protein K2Q08_02920 [Patescibacteria group bacterium]|nr:hypothetical protein [Patescibacteria group bacterium]